MALGELFLTLLLISSTASITLKFVHISDLHLDTDYSTKGDPDKNCHVVNGTGGEATLGPAGDYRCDPPPVLIKSAISFLARNFSEPEFILWTGDSNPHDPDGGPDFDYIFPNLRNISKLLANTFPNSHIIPVLGNHDTYKADNYPDFKTNDTKFYERYIGDAAFGDFIAGASRDTFKKCGYYSKEVVTDDYDLKFIVLNTNLYYFNQLPLDPDDPCDQIAWTRREVELAKPGQQVFILAHVPPGYYTLGKDPYNPTFSVPNGLKYMTELTSIFRNKTLAAKISAQFYGHSHHDTFRIFMADDVDEPLGVGFIGPSITPFEYVNPSIRVYFYDASNQTLLDYYQYVLPLNSTLNLSDIDNADVQQGQNRAGKEIESERTGKDRRLTNAKFTRSFARHSRQVQGDDSITTDKNIEVDNKTETSVETTTKEKEEDNEATTVKITEEPDDDSTEDQSDYNSRLVDLLKDKWILSYKATDALNVQNLSVKQMYLAYLEIAKGGPDGDDFHKFCFHYSSQYVSSAPGQNMCSRYDALVCPMLYRNNTDMAKCMKVPLTTTERTSQTELKDTTPEVENNDTTLEPEPEDNDPALIAVVPHDEENHSLKGIAIGFAIVIILALAIGGLLLYRKMQKNRYRSQEFLLTDSVFRYDGYAQVDET